MAVKLAEAMPAIFIVGLIAVVAMLSMFAVSSAATSNSGGPNGISDAACKAMADGVMHRAQALVPEGQTCGGHENENIGGTPSNGVSGNWACIWTYGGSKDSYDANHDIYMLQGLPGGPLWDAKVYHEVLESAHSVDYFGELSGYYEKQTYSCNVVNNSNQACWNPDDRVYCTFRIPAKK